MHGTNIEPIRSRASDVLAAGDVEKEVGRLALTIRPAGDKPEPVTGRMLDIAESSAQQVEQSADHVMKMAEAVAKEGRELAAQIRKGAEAYEARVAEFARVTQQTCLAVRTAANDIASPTEA